MHWPQVEMLRRWVADGELGSIQSITASAGWPRGDQYYSRVPWAARMEMAGSLVYDGPATNALSHLLNNICFFMGQENQFARPSAVSGWLARARSIESYDTFFSECQIGGADVRVFLTHAVSERVPFEIRVTGERATAWICETQPVLRRSDLEEVELPPLTAVKFPMYRRMVGAEGDFDGMPGTLEDMRGYTEWTEKMRLAGPVREIDPSLCFKNEEGVIAMRGMEAILHEFAKSGREVPIFGT